MKLYVKALISLHGKEIYGPMPYSGGRVIDEWREKDGTRGLRMKGDKRQTLPYHDTIIVNVSDVTVLYNASDYHYYETKAD